jgi:adenosylhomocysteine nucleosidase
MALGIIGAMEVEVESLVRSMDVSRTIERAGMRFLAGRLRGADVVVVRSGVGKVSAGMCVQVLVDEFDVDAVINTGVAGSLDNALDIGDIVVSTDAMYHDVDATVFGYAPGEIPQLGARSFPADEALRREAVSAACEAVSAAHVREGRVVSGDQFVADEGTKARLAHDFSGTCCEMEGAAIAQACWLNGVPFVVVRAISDKADGSGKVLYPVFERAAARHCAGIVERIAEARAGE